MTGFDYVVLLVVGFAAVAGFFRGFIEEVLALLAWGVALVAVHYLHEPLTYYLTSWLGSETGAGIVAFGILMAVPFFGTKLFARRMSDAARQTALGPIDRVLGFGFGAVKGFIIMTLAFSLLVFAYDVVWGPKGRPHWITAGRTYPFLNASSEQLLSLIAERRASALNADTPTTVSTTPDTTAKPIHSRTSHKTRVHRHPVDAD